MVKVLTSSIEIEAPVHEVWAVLVDFASYPRWNPFIVAAEGRVAVGERLRLRMQPTIGAAMVLRPTVVESVAARRLRWQGRLVVSGLFDAEHVFELEPLGPSRSQLVQREQFSGLLVPLFARSLDRGTLPAFHAMNAALKSRAEKAIAARA